MSIFKTEIDKILELLKKKKKLTAKEIAKELNIPEKNVIKYAELLEERGIVELHYSLLGGATIERKKDI